MFHPPFSCYLYLG